ncbi:hypothetical protein RSAG8_03693, partial [Rhizoctonia solani AG-8 WAC10335]
MLDPELTIRHYPFCIGLTIYPCDLGLEDQKLCKLVKATNRSSLGVRGSVESKLGSRARSDGLETIVFDLARCPRSGHVNEIVPLGAATLP